MIIATGTKTINTSVTRNPNRRGYCAVLAVLFAMGTSAAQATIRWVDSAQLLPSQPGMGCSPNAGYNTIQAAVNAALAGDTIMVCAGTYPENVSIPTASLALKGAQAGNPVAGRERLPPQQSRP
jgi:pectin methylesterase-like acyl-CoA thioesterase